jgi:hypothetical protein
MKPRLRILLTNTELANRGGSELFLRDVALGLLRRGHNPVAYSTKLGELSQELERHTVPVIDDLNALAAPPDVIHGQHHLETMTAMLRFPKTPVVFYCHGWLPWQERPMAFPSIARYVAVDDLCRERLLTTPGISAEQIRTLYNFVDLKRFRPRPPLPAKPRTALIFSNLASERTYAGVVRAACHEMGVERVDIMGVSSGNVQSRPEELLPQYDVVFAKARCALEAMAVGCAVVVTEYHGIGGLITPDNVAEMRRLNFGIRTMQGSPLSQAGLVDALSRYSPSDAREVSNWIRAEADLEDYLDKLESLYFEAREHAAACAISAEASLRAASDYIRSLATLVKRQAIDEQRAARLEHETRVLQQIVEQREAESRRLLSERNELEARLEPLEQSARALEQVHRSKSWRIVLAMHRIKNRLSLRRNRSR